MPGPPLSPLLGGVDRVDLGVLGFSSTAFLGRAGVDEAELTLLCGLPPSFLLSPRPRSTPFPFSFGGVRRNPFTATVPF